MRTQPPVLKWIALAAMATAISLHAEDSPPATRITATNQTGSFTETPAQHDARMAWWREARFGMFIHWGLYSVNGRHEWAMEQEAIPVSEYELFAKQFKPKPNAARDWARLAKKAGMRED